MIKNTSKPKKNVSVKDVIRVVSEFYGIEENTIFEKGRKKEVIKPRQVIMYLLREDFDISFPSIGDKVGNRDHSTVIHSYEKVKNDLKTDPELVQEIRSDTFDVEIVVDKLLISLCIIGLSKCL